MPRGIRGVRRSQELFEGIAATTAGLGIDVADIMWLVQTEPLIAIERLAVVHEKLGRLNKEANQVRQAWVKAGKPDIYTPHQQGQLF